MTASRKTPSFWYIGKLCIDAGAVSVAYLAFQRASAELEDSPHRLRPASWPNGQMGDLYGSLSATLGMWSNKQCLIGTIFGEVIGKREFVLAFANTDMRLLLNIVRTGKDKTIKL